MLPKCNVATVVARHVKCDVFTVRAGRHFVAAGPEPYWWCRLSELQSGTRLLRDSRCTMGLRSTVPRTGLDCSVLTHRGGTDRCGVPRVPRANARVWWWALP